MTLVSGDVDAFGHVRLGGIGDMIAGEIEARTGKEARAGPHDGAREDGIAR